MAFTKKTWKDRLVEYAGRRTLKRVSGSADSTMVVDVTRNEGTVSQAGDAFSATNMNDLETRISNGFNAAIETSKILDSRDAISANTKAGYVAGALGVKQINDSLVKNAQYVEVSSQSVVTVPAGGGINVDIPYTTPSNSILQYPISVASINSGWIGLIPQGIAIIGISSKVTVTLYNATTTARTVSPSITLTFLTK